MPARLDLSVGVGRPRDTINASEVRALVEREIDGDWNHTNFHRVDLRRCLLQVPRVVEVFVVDWKAHTYATEHMWLVLEEEPELSSGYVITYRESSGRFGVAQGNAGHPPTLLGEDDRFLVALDGM